jgi:hypothetical protein
MGAHHNMWTVVSLVVMAAASTHAMDLSEMPNMLRGFVRETQQHQEERELNWSNFQKPRAAHFDGDFGCRCPYPGEEIPPIIDLPIEIPVSGSKGSKGAGSKGSKGRGGSSKGSSSSRRDLSERAPYWHYTCEDIVWICPGDPIPDLPRWQCPLPIPPATPPTPASMAPPATSKGSKASKGEGKGADSKGSKGGDRRDLQYEGKGSEIATASKGSKGSLRNEGTGSEIATASKGSKGGLGNEGKASETFTASKGSKQAGSKGSKGGSSSEGKGGESPPLPPTPVAIIPPPPTRPPTLKIRYWDYLPPDRCTAPPSFPSSTPAPTYDGFTPLPTTAFGTALPTSDADIPTFEPTTLGELTALPTSDDTGTFRPSFEGCIETIVNFDTDASGSTLAGGTCVQNEWIDFGFTVSSTSDTAFPCLVDTLLVEDPGVVLGR